MPGLRAELKYWLGFNLFWFIDPLRFKLLYDYFGSAEKIWQATSQELRAIGLNEAIVSRFDAFREDLNPAEDIFIRQTAFGWQIEGINGKPVGEGEPVFMLTWLDQEYPPNLREIQTAPPVIYFKTLLKIQELRSLFTLPGLAVVGARKMTPYGNRVVRTLVRELSQNGILIVSGMARGIDTAAHLTAIETGGLTVAVLGCGIEVVYPPENREVYRKIISRGMVMSEFPLGTPPLASNFPRRNRLISGLAEAVLVVEAAERSGSLITASFAAEQGKDVFAVPGPIDAEMSAGTARLIKTGAKLITSIDDILEELVL